LKQGVSRGGGNNSSVNFRSSKKKISIREEGEIITLPPKVSIRRGFFEGGKLTQTKNCRKEISSGGYKHRERGVGGFRKEDKGIREGVFGVLHGGKFPMHQREPWGTMEKGGASQWGTLQGEKRRGGIRKGLEAHRTRGKDCLKTEEEGGFRLTRGKARWGPGGQKGERPHEFGRGLILGVIKSNTIIKGGKEEESSAPAGRVELGEEDTYFYYYKERTELITLPARRASLLPLYERVRPLRPIGEKV